MWLKKTTTQELSGGMDSLITAYFAQFLQENGCPLGALQTFPKPELVLLRTSVKIVKSWTEGNREWPGGTQTINVLTFHWWFFVLKPNLYFLTLLRNICTKKMTCLQITPHNFHFIINTICERKHFFRWESLFPREKIILIMEYLLKVGLFY